MTISTNEDVIAGEDLTVHGKKQLHTDDIAGTAKPAAEKFIEAKHGDGDVTTKVDSNRFSLMVSTGIFAIDGAIFSRVSLTSRARPWSRPINWWRS